MKTPKKLFVPALQPKRIRIDEIPTNDEKSTHDKINQLKQIHFNNTEQNISI